MLMQMLTETLLGALTGYMTNDTAIRSLFKPGGVIEKTRDDFAKEAGLLLEDQVLTRAVLAEQLQRPEVQEALSHALDHFLQEQLPSVMQQQNLKDLPDYDEIILFLQKLLVQFLQQEKEQLLILMKKHLPVDLILTEQQCQQITSQLETILIDSLQQEHVLTRFWNGWRMEQGQKTIAQLGLGGFCDTVLENAAAQSQTWPQQLQQQYGNLLLQLIQETIQKIDLHPVLLELDSVMEQYTLQQYISCDAEELTVLLQNLLASQSGQQMMAYLIAELLHAIETIDAPITEVLPDGMLEALRPLIQQQLPAVMEQVLNWISSNAASVNAMLECAVEEIAAETGGMKGMLLEQLKETVLAQVLAENNVVALLQQSIGSEQTTQQTVDILMMKLQEQLATQTVGELARQWNKNKMLEHVLQVLLQDNLQRMLCQSGSDWAKKLLNWKPGSLKLAEQQAQIELALAGYLVHAIDRFDFSAMILEQRDAIKQATILQLVSLQEEQLQCLLNKTVHQGCETLSRTLSQCSSDTIYRTMYQALEHTAVQQGQQWLKKMTAAYTINDLLDYAKDWLQQEKPQLIQRLTQSGLDHLQGQLSHLAEVQIQQLSEEDMLKLVQDLMGRELKPLNYLGAAMGAVVGATVGTALSSAIPVTAAVTPALMTSVLAGKSAVFGAVGYGTNCAAVKGLFWPYEPVAGITALQGVIPKQKIRFAHSMGNLVDRYVINETVLQELLQKLEPQLHTYSNAMAEDEHAMQLLAGEVASRRKDIAQMLLQWLTQNGAQFCHTELQKLGGMPLTFLCGSQLERVQLGQHLLPLAEQWLNQSLHSHIKLKQIVSSQQVWQMMQRMIAGQPLPDITAWGQQVLQTEKTLLQAVGDETMQSLQKTVQKKLGVWLTDAEHRNQLAETFCRKVSAERLQQWIQNSSGLWVQQNLSSLFGMVEQTLLGLMQSKQESITAAVQKAILNRMGLMQQMGYAMMNGDEIVARVVDRVLQQKLPIFLSTKSRELQELFQSCWEDLIFPAVLQVPVQQQQVSHVLKQLLDQPVLHRSISQIAGQAIQQFGNSAIASWGSLIQIAPLLERIQLQLGFQWKQNGELAIEQWQPLVENFYETTVGTQTLCQLTAGYDEPISLQQIVQYGQFSELLRGFQLRLQENLAITRLQYWCNWDEAAGVLDTAVQHILQDTPFQQWVTYEAQWMVLQMTDQWQNLLPLQSRKWFMQQAMQAAFATAQAHGTIVLQAMELSNLAETQLIAMDSAHLERVVRSFASSYLVHIENRGWMGAVFALPGMLIYLF